MKKTVFTLLVASTCAMVMSSCTPTDSLNEVIQKESNSYRFNGDEEDEPIRPGSSGSLTTDTDNRKPPRLGDWVRLFYLLR